MLDSDDNTCFSFFSVDWTTTAVSMGYIWLSHSMDVAWMSGALLRQYLECFEQLCELPHCNLRACDICNLDDVRVGTAFQVRLVAFLPRRFT